MQQINQAGQLEIPRHIEELFFKFILVGEPGVGKTSILSRYVDNKFSEKYNATVGVEFGAKTIELTQSTRLRLQIWDTTGQESFTTITKSFYRNSHCIFLVYDVNSRESFERLENWTEEVMEYAEPGSIIILIGNKAELKTMREVTYNEGINYMKEKGMHFFFETSAAQGDNVELAFLEAAKLAYMSYIQEGDDRKSNLGQKRDTVKLRNSSSQSGKGKQKGDLCDLSKQNACNCQ